MLLIATLGGGKTFLKLDLSQAYQQLRLAEESKNITTINKHASHASCAWHKTKKPTITIS